MPEPPLARRRDYGFSLILRQPRGGEDVYVSVYFLMVRGHLNTLKGKRLVPNGDSFSTTRGTILNLP